MKSQSLIIYTFILNAPILVGVWIARLMGSPLAYEIASIYAGVVTGTSFTLLMMQTNAELYGKSLLDVFRVIRQRRITRLIRGTVSGYVAMIGMSVLLGMIVLVGNNTFFGRYLDDNTTTSVMIIAFVGALYAMVLINITIWFDYWIRRGKPLDYIIALSSIIFVLVITAAASKELLRTPYFAVGIASRAISSSTVTKGT